MTSQILNDFKKQMQGVYGEDFFLQEIVKDGKKKVVVMTKGVREKLEDILKENNTENLEVSSIEENEGEEFVIKSGVIDLFTNRKKEQLADQLIKGERIRVFIGGVTEKNAWVPIAVHHDFEVQAPKELGWIIYDPSKLERDSNKEQKTDFSSDKFKQTVEKYLSKNTGIKYVLGGKTLELGFDCSGFTQVVTYKVLNIWLPRLSRWQALVGESIEKDQIKEGDLIYFDNPFAGRVTHIGVVYQPQEGKLPIIVHCPERDNGVIIEDLNEAMWLGTELNIGGHRRIL